MISIAISFFLVSTLLALLIGLKNPPATPDSALRLMTRHKVSLYSSLPIAYRDKIRTIEGVTAVSGMMWFGGIYRNGDFFFPQFAIDADRLFEIGGADLATPVEQIEAFQKDRAGAVAGRRLAQRMGWKLGDRIHLKGTTFSFNPELTLRAIYEGPQESTLYFRWDYLNEGLNDIGFTGAYWMKLKSSDQAAIVAKTIDMMFENSIAPTTTETEQAFVISFLSIVGNVQLLITSMCAVVLFAVVLIAANTMTMSIRERTREIGILKALGFRRAQILSLLLGESVVLALGGAIVGSWGARLFFSAIDVAGVTSGVLDRFSISPSVPLACALTGTLIGIVSSVLPAWQASRRSVVEALGSVE
jgi:putative ABC transport system permease protein